MPYSLHTCLKWKPGIKPDNDALEYWVNVIGDYCTFSKFDCLERAKLDCTGYSFGFFFFFFFSFWFFWYKL